MRVTVLIENGVDDACGQLSPEFGLSLHLERDGLQLLFDTGASGAFVDNANKLGLDLEEVQAAVISHHHFDHGGGLLRLLEVNSHAKVYISSCADREHSFRAFGLLRRPIGIDRELIDRNPARFEEISGSLEIAPGVFLLTEIVQNHPRPRGNKYLFAERDGERMRDSFDHELMLVLHDPDGLVVFTGCSHSGILNMIDTALERFPGTPVKAVFGGFHMIGLPLFNSMAVSRLEAEAIAEKIMERVQGTVYSGHCTGARAFKILKQCMGDRLQAMATGTSVDL